MELNDPNSVVPLSHDQPLLRNCHERFIEICADLLARAHLDSGNPEILLQSLSRYYHFLPSRQREVFLSEANQTVS